MQKVSGDKQCSQSNHVKLKRAKRKSAYASVKSNYVLSFLLCSIMDTTKWKIMLSLSVVAGIEPLDIMTYDIPIYAGK